MVTCIDPKLLFWVDGDHHAFQCTCKTRRVSIHTPFCCLLLQQQLLLPKQQVSPLPRSLCVNLILICNLLKCHLKNPHLIVWHIPNGICSHSHWKPEQSNISQIQPQNNTGVPANFGTSPHNRVLNSIAEPKLKVKKMSTWEKAAEVSKSYLHLRKPQTARI